MNTIGEIYKQFEEESSMFWAENTKGSVSAFNLAPLTTNLGVFTWSDVGNKVSDFYSGNILPWDKLEEAFFNETKISDSNIDNTFALFNSPKSRDYELPDYSDIYQKQLNQTRSKNSGFKVNWKVIALRLARLAAAASLISLTSYTVLHAHSQTLPFIVPVINFNIQNCIGKCIQENGQHTGNNEIKN